MRETTVTSMYTIKYTHTWNRNVHTVYCMVHVFVSHKRFGRLDFTIYGQRKTLDLESPSTIEYIIKNRKSRCKDVKVLIK